MNTSRPGASSMLIGKLALLVSGCASQSTAAPTLPPAAPSTETPVPTRVLLPAIGLEAGDFYFRVDGTPKLLYSRDLGGYQQAHYNALLDMCRKGGSTIARIQLDSFQMGYLRDGGVDSNWLAQWDQVLSRAEADGIYVLPVFSGWFDWNAGPGYSQWKSNPLNQANGGPVKDPAELFQQDSDVQKLWLAWMETVVRHWAGRRNITGRRLAIWHLSKSTWMGCCSDSRQGRV